MSNTIHSSVQPTPVVLPNKTTAGFHAQLLRVTTSNKDGDEVRQDLRRVVQDLTGATCVAHLVADENGQFNPAQCICEGELPAVIRNGQQLASLASTAFARQSTQLKALPEKTQLLCVPVSLPGHPGEVLIAMLASGLSNIQSALFNLEVAATYQRLWARGCVAVANQWKLNSLAAIVELVTNIQQEPSVDAAATVAVHEATAYLGCARVAIATSDASDVRVRAISGVKDFDDQSETVALFREALAECTINNDICQWPADENNTMALLAHQALAKQQHFGSILTAPLRNVDGEIMGAWLFADNEKIVTNDRFQGFVRAASPRIASALEVIERSNRGILAKLKDSVGELLKDRKGKAGAVAAVLLLSLMLVPVPYRVRCQCVVEPVARRYAVAPFTGMVDEALVEPGEIVTAGTLLARMDGREVNWNLSETQAKRQQAQKQREIELSQRNIPGALISQFDTEQLDAQLEVLRYRAENLELRAAVDGMVLSGSLERGQSAPVQTGDVLYEIGPLDELKVEVEIPANELAQIREGHRVKVWINGLETEAIVGEIVQIQPRSELREDQNVFVAGLNVQNPDKLLRPGMRGTARISGNSQPLGWNLFHKPYEYLVSRLTWW